MRLLYITRHFNHSGYAILERLLTERFNIVAVVLHKDRDIWRRSELRPFLQAWYRLKCAWYRCAPLRTVASEEVLAKKHGIPILFVKSINDDECFSAINRLSPDLIVLGGGWHELLPERVYTFPPLGCINTHPSMLPEFRGTSITRWQILSGVNRSGSTIHYVDSKFDSGGILAVKEVPVPPDATPQALFQALALAGAEMMPGLLRAFETSGRQPAHSRQGNPRYCRYFTRWVWNENALVIDWSKSLRDVHFHVLANTQESYEYAGPWFILMGKRYILRITHLHENPQDIVKVNVTQQNNLVVAKVNNGSIFLRRHGDPNILEMVQVQRDDCLRKIRRAYPAAVLGLVEGDLFQTKERDE
jgi:methionyl-tRNA formyltransferase